MDKFGRRHRFEHAVWMHTIYKRESGSEAAERETESRNEWFRRLYEMTGGLDGAAHDLCAELILPKCN